MALSYQMQGPGRVVGPFFFRGFVKSPMSLCHPERRQTLLLCGGQGGKQGCHMNEQTDRMLACWQLLSSGLLCFWHITLPSRLGYHCLFNGTTQRVVQSWKRTPDPTTHFDERAPAMGKAHHFTIVPIRQPVNFRTDWRP